MIFGEEKKGEKMGKCIKMECYYCKTIRYFYVNVNNYKCTQCGRIVSHPLIDERYTTVYGYTSNYSNIVVEDLDEILSKKDKNEKNI